LSAQRVTSPGTVALRRTLGLFCTGVTVISANDPESGPRGMTANAFMSGSLSPPLIVVSVHVTARLHPSLAAAGAYGVSILPETLEREARRFAGLPIAAHEPPPQFAWRQGVPLLAGALGWFAARVVGRHEIGDHTMFVGHVLDFGMDEPGAAPLGYYSSSYARVLPYARDVEIDPWGGALLDLWG
jgi:flavin reductase (DIM6/NTAB) family NADH-FMN oxidoreductase RutF